MKEVDETVAMHDAVVKVLELTDASDTLVIVTGDHSISMTVNGYATINRNVLGKIKNVYTHAFCFTTITEATEAPSAYTPSKKKLPRLFNLNLKNGEELFLASVAHF